VKNAMKVTTSGDREVVITRTFDAPRELVWETMSRPELLKRWLFGPPGWEMTECSDDPRVGGKFRWAWSGPGGATMTMTGTYREVAPPERAVRTECFEVGCGPQMGEQLTTLVLTERGGQTLLTLNILYPSREARDAALASGMEHGMAAGYARLDGFLADKAA
jgi:uncharacterized protein YndB with AHSA1/START domain